jgi:hypothetical protein
VGAAARPADVAHPLVEEEPQAAIAAEALQMQAAGAAAVAAYNLVC